MVLQHRAGIDLRTLWPFAVIATIAVVFFPVAAVLVLANIGLPDPEALIAGLACVILSIGTAAVGSSMWMRRRESIDVAFGELMLWRFLRRHKAERTIDKGAEALGFGPDWSPRPRPIVLDPDRALDVLRRLTTALEAKDPYTHGHSRRVERHVHRTAMAMGLSSDQIKELRTAASLHDVGKIRIPSQVLRKPDALTGNETSIMREHVHLGAALVGEAAPPGVTNAILHHHECWDGSGYPAGLSEQGIPLYSRVIAVADTYDALTSARPYRAGCSRREAIEVLRTGAGVQFDPHVVEAFISTLPAALPAVSALLIFVAPERVARRVVAWARSSAVGSVTGGAAAAGSAAAVITAGILMGPGGANISPDRAVTPEKEPATVELVQDSSALQATDAGGSTRHKVARAEARRGGPGLRALASPNVAGSAEDPRMDAFSAQPNAPAGNPDPPDQGNGSDDGDPPGNGGGDAGNDPPGPTDPPPGNGNDDDGEDNGNNDDDDDGADDEDCEPKNGKGHDERGEGHGYGHDNHCGE
ncbi:MAG: HD-GYP domain-containing protein [Actinomycetota bacterium]